MNEIAKLLKAYDRFWADVENLYSDLNNIMLNDFGMSIFEDYQDSDIPGRIYSSYFKDKTLIYIIFDHKVDIPFIQIFYLNQINKKKNLDEHFLKENWKKYDPLKIIKDDGYKTKKISDHFFSVLIDYGECFVSEKIDIMSIDSTDIVNTEIKELIEVFFNNKYKQYATEKLKFILE
jgi:Zn-dependent peptidase ImmA (M78 family)